MVKALIALAQLVRTTPLFEAAGTVAIVVGVVVLAGFAWGLIAAGAFLLLKAFDMELDKSDEPDERR